MDKKKIKINFMGFWGGFDPYNNDFVDILKKHYEVEVSDEPDYVFYSVFSDQYINCDDVIRIFFTGECQTPDFNLCDYAIGFDHITMGDRFFRYPLYMFYGDNVKKALERNGMIKSPIIRDKFCSFVYSNSKAAPIRREFFEKLSEYKKVDSGGRYMNNVGAPVKDKRVFESEHKFSIAFENASYSGYTSEKLLVAFAAGTVPIYWGDPDVTKIYNEKAFINVNAYDNIDDAVKYIEQIDNDDEKFIQMIQQPVFCDENYLDKERARFESFLIHIFEQEKGKAFRRNRSFRGKNYELFFKRWCNVNAKLKAIKKIIRKC